MLDLSQFIIPNHTRAIDEMRRKAKVDRTPERNRKRLVNAIKKAIENLKGGKEARQGSKRSLYWTARDGSDRVAVRILVNGQHLPLNAAGAKEVPQPNSADAVRFFEAAIRQVESGQADEAIRAASEGKSPMPVTRRRGTAQNAYRRSPRTLTTH